MVDEMGELDVLENKETAHRLPIGWLLLFFGLMLWGLYYIAVYTPAFSGWTQQKAYEESLAESDGPQGRP